ncbi:AMP-binding protein [Kutzneria albida]|uniref:AMP-dependent synthetase/ligase domain-containing protein n=1 Tax=Kutzneria albida DSM 43870 TaxID=1449976 RepID=W5WG38_9PSEU|nr:AMP-binding protein [Kutzneria albida]AHH99581.1 hypothetical protein KALB_6221 [Kutzneria albida DSM 43870]
MTAAPQPELAGLSCYTGSLAGYLDGEPVDAAELLANSIRLAVRIDLPEGALAFSHHRFPLNRLPNGDQLHYAAEADPQRALAAITAELSRHGRVIVVVDNAELPWSPSYGVGPSAPHWLLLSTREEDKWHVVDPFSGLLPAGEQHPFTGWLSTESLLAALAPRDWAPEQLRRNELAFGLPVPVAGSGLTWLGRVQATRQAEDPLPGNWLTGCDQVLPFLIGHLERRLAESGPLLDDLWAAAQHHVFRHRWLGERAGVLGDLAGAARHESAAQAWASLPKALRFAVESASRGRPRATLVRTTLNHLLALETPPAPAYHAVSHHTPISTRDPEGPAMPTRTLYDWFLNSATQHPDNTAIEVSTQSLTYAELRAAVERLSGAMVEVLGRTPTRVGLLTSRSLAGYVGYLAAQRLGAACVPLNSAAPAVRNLTITTEAELDLTLVDDTSGDGLAEYRRDCGIALLDLTGDRVRELTSPSREYKETEVVPRGAEDVAYIIFTSGTTGKPKGVPTTQSNVDAFLAEVIERYTLLPTSRVSQTFEMSFDGSIVEIFGTWGSGGALCVAQHGDVFTPVKFVKAKQLTHWMSVPSLISFATRLRALAPGSMPTLTGSMFGGEALTMEQAEAWSAAAPSTRILNCYGPTETTVTVTGYEVPLDGSQQETSNRTIPIGDVYPHMESVLLDANLRPVDDGELCVRGPQRFPGYLDPAENAGRFVSFDGVQGELFTGGAPLTEKHWYRTGDRVRREHGTLVHLGRIDEQVKVRGNRVELGEIESVLRRHPAIAEVVVLTIRGADGEIDLYAVYTGGKVSDAEFAGLVEGLPTYMHPRGYHHREEIPLTTVGKVDRKLLTDQFVAVAR